MPRANTVGLLFMRKEGSMAGHLWELVIPLILVFAGLIVWTARRVVERFMGGIRGE